jgi:hypothetical protein
MVSGTRGPWAWGERPACMVEEQSGTMKMEHRLAVRFGWELQKIEETTGPNWIGSTRSFG